jgi:putative ABC transport system permease protein
MRPVTQIRLGLRNVLVHRLRSALSILGVVFGVAAVVAMSSVGEGARREALAQIGALGIDSITVRARKAATEGAVGLSLRDAESLAAVVPGLVVVAPLREAPLEAAAGSRRIDVAALGTVPGYRTAARLALASGRFLGDVDVRDRKRVAVLGASVAHLLFPLADPRGETLLLGGDWFRVVGVLEGRFPVKGRGAPIRTHDVNKSIFVPLTALDRGEDSRADGIDEICLRVADASRVTATAEVVKSVVERTAGSLPLDVVVPRQILQQRERTQRVFNVVTGAVAGISLLVGGIGIMNIMLANVAERTGEIGVRRALGASRRDILSQFLVESSLLTSCGGLLGIALGLLGSAVIQTFAGWPTAISPVMVLVAVATALSVGIGFGLYPAWEAARLLPMDALRHE